MKVTNTLVDKFRKGNIRTHQYYYRHWYPALHKDAVAVIGHAAEATAIVNDVFIRLWMRCEYFDTHNNISAFLHIHVRHSCHDYLNRTRRPSKMQRHLQHEVLGEQAADIRDGFTRALLLDIIESENTAQTRQARELFRVVYTRKISLEAAAHELKITVQEAEERLRLAMQMLHLILWQGEEQPGVDSR
jgi:RNA polymerase sigma factor (sigma-70 family)